MLELEPNTLSRPPGPFRSGLTSERLAWLIQLRWVALIGIVLAGTLSVLGAFPGVNWPVLFATAAGAAFYNAMLWIELRRGVASTLSRSAMYQALTDLLLLTIVLWTAGGLASPFLTFYVFHIALIGILSGPRAAMLAGAAALAGAALLWLTEQLPPLRIGRWDPVGAWDQFASVVAFVATVGGMVYLVTHALRELRDRERALEDARDRAELEYELLSNTLDELDAGLEVVDANQHVVWRNRLAQRLIARTHQSDPWQCRGSTRPCERDASKLCPLERSLRVGQAGRCRFAVDTRGQERVYELLSFPLSAVPGQPPRVMNLYIDRTSATLAERQLMLAERLASLGRVAQGVAHELNTPLATIRTLAADMVVVLRSLGTAEPDTRDQLAADAAESASLIREETGRLGRIAQDLLAGGDMVRVRITTAVPLAAVVERARALVFAGVRSGPRVELDPSLDGVRLRCDQDRLVQVLVNLLQNAHDALRGRGQGKVRVAAWQEPGSRAVCIAVEDDGPGIDPSLSNRLFEPFTTTKPPGEGTGLGLYTSYMLVQAMHGTLALLPRTGGGTQALISLPEDDAAAAERTPLPREAAG